MNSCSSDHVPVNIEMLVNSLTGRFKNLNPLSEDCCIYRVPPKIRTPNQTHFTPRVVSIGPLHHHTQQLQPMEEHKLRYLKQFLDRTSVKIEEFLKHLEHKEVDIRNCYAETINLSSEEFLEMILLDAVFLIEILIRYIPQFIETDRIFTRPGLLKDLVLDVMLLENQIPLFILVDLFGLANLTLPKPYQGYTLCQFTWAFFKYVWKDMGLDKIKFKSLFAKAKHFVHLSILCLQPDSESVPSATKSHQPDSESAPSITKSHQPDPESAPSITKLHQSGMKFKLIPDRNPLDIRFNKGTLEVPKVTISNMTVHLLRNLQAFEALHCANTNHVNDYAIIQHRLLSTTKDVELLIQAGVIDNRILDSEGVSTFFKELSGDARVDLKNFYYSGLVEDLKEYCKSPCRKWKANLKQKYFNTPWASISVIAAAIILLLTFIQAVCSIIALRWQRN